MGPPRQGSSQKTSKDKKKPAQTPRRSNQRKPAQEHEERSLVDLSATIPLTLQQLLLNVFRTALLTTTDQSRNPPIQGDSSNNAGDNTEPRQLDIKTLIQTIKSHLYNRDFDSAFTDASGDLLRAYALRWSSTRALGYTGIFKALFKDLLEGSQTTTNLATNKHVVCIGGGAGAEIVALAATWRDLLDESEQKALIEGVGNVSVSGNDEEAAAEQNEVSSPSTTTTATASHPALTVTAVDIADWSTVVDRLATTISSTDVRGSKSHAAPLVDPSRGRFSVRSRRSDVLMLSDEGLKELLHLPPPTSTEAGSKTPAATVLVTLMFTLNELFSTSMAKATGFLLRMTDLLQPGTVLLVVDSPGSYSTLKLGKGNKEKGSAEAESAAPQERNYPMKFLLDHALLSVAQGKWERVFSQDSRWWRRDAARLSYDVGEGAGLEDMRFQVHIYRRLGG